MLKIFLVVLLLTAPLGLSSAMATPDSQPMPTIVAHRGASQDRPENTLASMREAWRRGADAIEMDIWLTSDGHPMVIHDAELDRTTNGHGRVDEHTLAQVQQLDAGAWKDPRWAGERVPTLAQVLQTVPKGKHVYAELKSTAADGVIDPVRKALHTSGLDDDRITVIGFDAPSVQAMKAAEPSWTVYLLRSFHRDKQTHQWTPTIAEAIARAKSLGVDGLDVSYKGPLDEDAVAQIRAAGLGLAVWTVNDMVAARRMTKLGVDGITTNRPRWMREGLGEGQAGRKASK